MPIFCTVESVLFYGEIYNDLSSIKCSSSYWYFSFVEDLWGYLWICVSHFKWTRVISWHIGSQSNDPNPSTILLVTIALIAGSDMARKKPNNAVEVQQLSLWHFFYGGS